MEVQKRDIICPRSHTLAKWCDVRTKLYLTPIYAFTWLFNCLSRRQSWAWCLVRWVGRAEAIGCQEAAERRSGMGGLRPEARSWRTSAPQNKPTASLNLKGVSGSQREAVPLSHWLPVVENLLLPCPTTQTLTRSKCPPMPIQSGERVAAHVPDLPSHSPPCLPAQLISPADSINQFDATAAESQAIMENRPGALELTHTEGPERPPSRQRGGVEAGQYRQMLANLGCTREPAGSFEKYSPSPQCRCPG